MQDNREQLAATTRSTFGKKVRFLRRDGWTPANISGQGATSTAIQLRTRDLDHLLRYGTRNALVAVSIDGQAPTTVLPRRVQRKPTTGEIYHVDLFRVAMDQALRVQVPILFSGEAPAIKQHDAIIMRAREALEVECLPGDMPSEIVVSIESLAEIDDAIYVRDLPLPPNVKSVIDDDELVVRALAPTVSREEAGEEAAEATPAAEAGESAGTTPSETAAGA